MADILSALEESYVARCSDPAAARAAWLDVAAEFPPSLDARAGGLLPSTAIALHSGDLGLAMLWIVQAAVVRPLAADLVRDAGRYHPALASIQPAQIGALAHSEDRSAPVIIERADGGVRLNGKKKYITGGLDADFVLVTAREKGDEKVTSLVYLPRPLIGDGALADLSMNILRTVGHASLSLDGTVLPEEHLADIDPAALRRHLKRWGIIERCLIMEAFLGVMLYIAERSGELLDAGDVDLLGSLLENQRRASSAAIAAARAGEKIDAGGANLPAVIGLSGRLGASITARGASFPEDLALRHGDLSLFSRFRP